VNIPGHLVHTHTGSKACSSRKRFGPDQSDVSEMAYYRNNIKSVREERKYTGASMRLALYL